MKLLISIILLLLPALACAVEGCKVIEFEDRTEVVCEGDGKPVPAVQPAAQSVQPQPRTQTPEPYQNNETAEIPAPPKTADSDKSKTADPDQAAASGTTMKNSTTVVGPNPRSPRATPAERNAAAAERKRLIMEQRPLAN